MKGGPMLDKRSVSHYVPYDEQAAPRTIVQAVCGSYIRKMDSRTDPSCPVCRQYLAERDADRPLAWRIQ